MRNCLGKYMSHEGLVGKHSNSFCLKFWLVRYCGGIQSECHELSAAVANCVRCNPRHSDALVRTRHGEAFVRIENRFRHKNSSLEESRTKEQEQGKRKGGKRAIWEREREKKCLCNQPDSLGAIRAIHRSASEHVRNCMPPSPEGYWLHPAMLCVCLCLLLNAFSYGLQRRRLPSTAEIYTR